MTGFLSLDSLVCFSTPVFCTHCKLMGVFSKLLSNDFTTRNFLSTTKVGSSFCVRSDEFAELGNRLRLRKTMQRSRMISSAQLRSVRWCRSSEKKDAEDGGREQDGKIYKAAVLFTILLK